MRRFLSKKLSTYARTILDDSKLAPLRLEIKIQYRLCRILRSTHSYIGTLPDRTVTYVP